MTSVLLGGFHACIDRVGSYNIYSWDGVSLGFSIFKKVLKSWSGDNTRLNGSRELGEGLLGSSLLSAHLQGTVHTERGRRGESRSRGSEEKGGKRKLHC